MDFTLWARIHQVGPQEFLVIVSARGEGPEHDDMRTVVESSIETARATRNQKAREMGEALLAAGHRVVNVEIE